MTFQDHFPVVKNLQDKCLLKMSYFSKNILIIADMKRLYEKCVSKSILSYKDSFNVAKLFYMDIFLTKYKQIICFPSLKELSSKFPLSIFFQQQLKNKNKTKTNCQLLTRETKYNNNNNNGEYLEQHSSDYWLHGCVGRQHNFFNNSNFQLRRQHSKTIKFNLNKLYELIQTNVLD